MVRKARASSIDDRLDSLKRAASEANTEAGRIAIEQALLDNNWLLVSEACGLITKLGLDGFSAQLLEVWPRFCQNGPKRDPGCRAKEAALRALDYLEILDPDPFLTAIRYQQLEPVLGGKVDTAGGLRVRALLALFRMAYSKAALYAGELMADSDAQVRAGVAQAILHYEDGKSAALLTHKLREGRDEPPVLLECALALLNVDVSFGLGLLVPLLSGHAELMRETAALALGQSRDPRAAEALLEWTDSVTLSQDQDLGIRALGLSRHEPARRYLLRLVESGVLARARAAVEALAVHRYDIHLAELVRIAAKKRGDAPLCELVERVFHEP